MKAQLAGLALTALLVTTGAAHHPFSAEFDMSKPMTLSGTVSRITWGNPHATLEVKVIDPKTAGAAWIVELDNTADLERLGWRREAMKVGDQVKVEGWVAKADPHKLGAKTVTFNNGKPMTATSSFYEDPPGRSAAR